MNKLYCVPLGATARKEFIKAVNQDKEQKSVLVLPSGILMGIAKKEGAKCVDNFDGITMKLLNANGYSGLKRISRRTQELIIEEILNKQAQNNELAYFQLLVEKKGFVKAITNFMGQLSRAGVTADEFSTAIDAFDRAGKYGLKDKEVAKLYELYRAELEKKNWYDLERLYSLAISLFDNGNVPILPWEHLYFSEFYEFSAVRLELLKCLSKHCGVNVGLMYEPNREEVFGAVKKTYEDLIGFLDSGKITTEPIARKSAIADLVVGSYYIYQNDAVTLFKADSREQECRAILQSVKKRLLEGVSCDDIVVFVRDFKNYKGLRALCDEYGIPVSLPKTLNLATQPLTELLVNFFKVAENGFNSAEALKSLLSCRAMQICFGLKPNVLNKCLAEKFYYKADILKTDLLAKADETDAEILQNIFAKTDGISSTDSVFNYCAHAKSLLADLQLAPKVGEAYKNNIINIEELKNTILTQEAILSVIVNLLEDYSVARLENIFLSAKDFANLLSEASSEIEVVLQKGDIAGVLFTKVANIQGMWYKYVYIMGVREGEFPTVRRENWIYNDAERAELSILGIELNKTVESFSEDRYFFYTAVATAAEHLTVSWYEDDSAKASQYIEMLREDFVKDSLNITTVQSGDESNLYSEKELSVYVASNDKHYRFLEKYKNWHQKAFIETARQCGFGEFSGVIMDEALAKCVAEKIGEKFSASALKRYAECPFSYLVDYVWNTQANEEKLESIEPNIAGSVLHEILAKFMEKYLGRRLCDYEMNILIGDMETIAESVFADFIAQAEITVTPFWEFRKNEILKTLRWFLAVECDYQHRWPGYKPDSVEQGFNTKNKLDLSSQGMPVYFSGRIDRIDRSDNKLFITDYKLAGTPGNSDFQKGLDLQLPIYYLALTSENKLNEITGVGYYSLKDLKRTNSVLLDDDDKFPFKGTIKTEAKEKFTAQDFERKSIDLVLGYVDGIRTGQFMPMPKKPCYEYCPAKDICRMYGVKIVEGGERND